MPSQILLSDAQRLEFTSVQDTITDDELEYFYSLRDEDIQIVNSHRGDENRLGFAMNLCCLRHKGWPYLAMAYVAPKVISYVAGQIGTPATCIEKYGDNKSTRYNHLSEICTIYGYRQDSGWPELESFIYECARKMNDLMSIIKETIRFAVAHRIIPPRITTLERIVRDTVNKEEERIFKMIYSLLSDKQKEQLDRLMELGESNTSGLFDIKDVSGRWNSRTFKEISDKLDTVKGIGIPERLGDIHPNLLKTLSRQAYRYAPSKLKRFSDEKRYALLAMLVHQQTFWLTDMAVDMNDKILSMMESDAKKTASAFLMDKKDEIDRNYRYFHRLGESIYEAMEAGKDIRKVVEEMTTLDELREKLDSRFTPHEGDMSFHEKMLSGYSVIRRYAPLLLKQISFRASSSSSNDLLSALDVMRNMFERKSSGTIPQGTSLSFIKDDWMPYVLDSERDINKEAFVVATMMELRRQVRSGDIWVEGSYKYSSLESLLVPAEEIDKTKMGVGVDFKSYIEGRSQDMRNIFDAIDSDAEAFSKLKRKDKRLHPERLANDVPEGAPRLSSELYSMLPRVTLSEMLFEVNKWTGFVQDFTHMSTRQRPAKKDEPAIIAALSAMGLNIGLQKMSECSDDVTYTNLSTMANWRLYDESLKRAQATLVNYQHHLPLARNWGDGTTSSSDGMRVICGVRSLLASHNPHYGSAQGVTMYRHTSDEYSAFYVNVINTNIRDAVHVIDGVLHHESELEIETHYTDTAGYTEQIFGLSHLLGFMFAPRIRDIADSILYVIPGMQVSQCLADVAFRSINTRIIEENYDDVLRIVYSIKTGYVSCDMVMSRLGSYSRQNSVARALKEMGRIEKTIFLLKYLSNEGLRREILVGLNKGEAMNGLARALFFGKSGNLREKDLQEQLQRASCLNILLNVVVIWNTVYLSRAIEHKRRLSGFDDTLIQHISPLNWNHIQLYGRYYFNEASSLEAEQYRELRLQDRSDDDEQAN